MLHHVFNRDMMKNSLVIFSNHVFRWCLTPFSTLQSPSAASGAVPSSTSLHGEDMSGGRSHPHATWLMLSLGPSGRSKLTGGDGTVVVIDGVRENTKDGNIIGKQRRNKCSRTCHISFFNDRVFPTRSNSQTCQEPLLISSFSLFCGRLSVVSTIHFVP